MDVNLYMKSGNVVHLAGIQNYQVKATGNTITSLFLERKDKSRGERLVMTSLNLDQIEAITIED